MGYDMYIEAELTEAEQVAKTAADDQFEASWKERDKLERNTPEWDAAQERVMKAAGEMDRHNLNYFRLNIWGMGRCRRAMYEVGMAYDSDHGEFPDYDPPTSAEGGKDALVEAEEKYSEEYQAACMPVLAEHPEGGDTIPLHKFCDNSGWLVTEEECTAAVKRWKEYEAESQLTNRVAVLDEDGNPDDSVESTLAAEWWPEWIAFLERASTRGGFRVH